MRPREEQPAATLAGAAGDPLVNEVLAKVRELELLAIEPEHELDRLGHQRPRVPHRRLTHFSAARHAPRELMRDLRRRVGADVRAIAPGRDPQHRRGVPRDEPVLTDTEDGD
ncbi:MAG: hypothetical protein WBP81_34855, partial [Solirubrobacteraceae bacterium]